MEPCILITHETCPDDIAGMHKAQGILTATDGATSHAAVVARGMDKPCIVSTLGMVLGTEKLGSPTIEVGAELMVYAGEKVTILGATGRVWFGIDVPVEYASDDPDARQICLWAVQTAHFSLETPFPDTRLGQRTIKLAAFWGQNDVLAQLLEQIQISGNPELFVLDATPLLDLVQDADIPLYDCFGSTQASQTASCALDRLKVDLLQSADLDALKGLTISGIPADGGLSKKLTIAGFKVVTPAKSARHSFRRAGDRYRHIHQGYHESHEAMTSLLEWATDDSKATGIMRRVPMEYAAFSAFR